MKKTILSTLLVATIVTSAHASTITTQAGDVELFGQVHAGYDITKTTATTEEVNTRDTFIGVRGELKAPTDLRVAYELRADLQDDNTVSMERANITIGAKQAALTVGRAERAFDKYTADMDGFGTTFTGDFDLFSEVRVGDGVSVEAKPLEGLTIAVDVIAADGGKLGDQYSFTGRYEVNGLAFVAGYELIEEGMTETKNIKYGASYDLSALGAKGLTAGVIYSDKDADDNADDMEVISLTAKYKLSHKVAVLGGYANYTDLKEVSRVAIEYRFTKDLTATAGFAKSDVEDGLNETLQTASLTYKF